VRGTASPVRPTGGRRAAQVPHSRKAHPTEEESHSQALAGSRAAGRSPVAVRSHPAVVLRSRTAGHTGVAHRIPVVGRLLAELREGHAALTLARRELEVKTSAVARLEQAHDALLRRNQALERSLAQLEERQAILLRDREQMLQRVESVLRRLTS